MKKYKVELGEKQRRQLESLLKGGKESARSQMHARILLKADQGAQGPAWTDEQIAEALEVGTATVERVRRRFVEGGLLDARVAASAARTTGPEENGWRTGSPPGHTGL